jgi:hypothetical protein
MRVFSNYLITAALMLCAAAPAMAQECEGKRMVGYLGISGIACDCTISDRADDNWSFRSEPRITSLEMDSKGARVLRTGDVITHVNGKRITTREGAKALQDIDPGDNVVLTVRRNGESLQFAIAAGGLCTGDSRLFHIYAPYLPQGAPPPPDAVVGVTPRPDAPRAYVPGKISSGYAYSTGGGTVYSTSPRASFGMGLSCSGNCTMWFSEKGKASTMKFSEPPEVYSVESGGPADRAGIRRGDVVTHINGVRLDTDEGGRIFANVQPGQMVKFTVERDGDRKTFTVHASERISTTPALAQTSESLDKARAALRAMQEAQTERMRELQEQMRNSDRQRTEEMRELQRKMLEQQREHAQKLTELSRELSRADSKTRSAWTSAANAACAVTPAPPPSEATRVNRTLRYTGQIGNAAIEVRGSSPVNVTENRDEVVVILGGTVVRVRKNKN